MGQLQQAASLFDSNGNYAGGVPYFEELVYRLKDYPDPPPIMENAMFYIGLGHMQAYGSSGEATSLGTAIQKFQEYIDRYPDGTRVPFAYMNMADCYRGQAKWEESTKPLIKLLEDYGNRINLKVQEEALRKLCQSFYYGAAKKQELWDPGIPWFEQLLNLTYNRDVKAEAAAALMEAYFYKDELDRAMKYLPYMAGRSEARFSVRFNIQLLKAGDKYDIAGKYNDASIIFNMVLTVPKIREFNEKRKAKLESRLRALKLLETAERQKEILEVETQIQNVQLQLDALDEIPDYTPDLKTRIARMFVATSRDWEGFWAYWELQNRYPDHKQLESFVYSAFMQADKVKYPPMIESMGEFYLSRDDFSTYVKEVTVILAKHYNSTKQWDKFFRISKDFIQRYPKDGYTAQMAYFMGDAWVKLEEPGELLDTFAGKKLGEEPRDGGYIYLYPDSPMIDGCLYWAGLAAIFNEEMDAALGYFLRVINEYPESPYYEDAFYRAGICYFGLATFDNVLYTDARLQFEEFIKKWPGNYTENFLFFLEQNPDYLGQPLTVKEDRKPTGDPNDANAEDTTEAFVAKPDLIQVPEEIPVVEFARESRRNRDVLNFHDPEDPLPDGITPDSRLRGEAHFFLGQIYGLEGQPDMALNHYHSVERFTDVHRYIHDAYFEAGKLIERQGKSFRKQGYEDEALEQFREMEQTFLDYMTRYREVGQVTEATYRLGTAYELMNEPHRMLSAYLAAIRRFGNAPERYGLDIILDKYSEKYYEHQDRIQANIKFLQKIINDDVFRKRIVGLVQATDEETGQPLFDEETGQPVYELNRAEKPRRNKRFVFQYFMGKDEDGGNLQEDFIVSFVHEKIIKSLQRNDDFARQILKDTTPLEEMLEEWQDLWSLFPKEKPEETFFPMWENAKLSDEMTTRFRLQKTIEQITGEEIDEYYFTPSDFKYGSPALIVWMGDKAWKANDPQTAREAYRLVYSNYPERDAALQAYIQMGHLHNEYYFEYDKAYAYFKAAYENFPMADEAPQLNLLMGDMLYKQANDTEASSSTRETYLQGALDQYLEIIKTPSWRGPVHAEASYKAGLCYEAQGDYDQAYVYYRRCSISYGFYADWASKSYLKCYELLREGKTEQTVEIVVDEENNIRETVPVTADDIKEQFLEKDLYKDTEAYRQMISY